MFFIKLLQSESPKSRLCTVHTTYYNTIYNEVFWNLLRENSLNQMVILPTNFSQCQPPFQKRQNNQLVQLLIAVAVTKEEEEERYETRLTFGFGVL